MLPIIPNSKKATSTRRKRPRILPSASASSKKKKSNIIKQPTSKVSVASLKDDTTITQDDTAQKQQHEPITLNNNINSNVNEEEDTLLLAAEAAAALMDEIPNSLSATNNSTANNNGTGGVGNAGGNSNNNGSGLDYADIPMNLLDEVNTSVEYAASMMTKEQLQNESSESEVKEKDMADDSNSIKEKEGGLKVPSLPPIQYNNNIETISTNPLGSEVISFESKLPQQQNSNESTSTMSTAQKNFLNHYYYNGLNEGSGDKSVLLNGNSSSLKRVGDKSGEEDEEIVEEDDTTTAKQKKGKVNMTKEGEEPSLPQEEAATGSAEPVVALTLRTVCASIPRTIKKKNKNLKLKNEGENDNLIAEEEAAAMGTADEETAATTGQEKDITDKAQAPTTEEAATEETPETATGPQVKVNEQGEIVIEQESLLPNPETRQSTAQIDQELGNTVIDEGETPSQLGAIQARYDSYTSQPRQIPTRWSVTETKSFYRALRQCGTDFSMMEMFLVGRTRSQLKRKFKIESRKNARLIDMALNPRQKVKLDLSVFGDNLVIPTEVPAIKVLPPVEDTTMPTAAVAKKGQQGTEKKKSMEKSFDHLFQEEDGDDTAIANDGDEIDESVQKGKSDEVPAQATAVVPPVIAAAKSTTSKTKAKKAFKPKVKKPKKNIKKAVSVKK